MNSSPSASNFIQKTQDSLSLSSSLLSSLTFTHAPRFTSFALASLETFETDLIRDASPHELSLFRPSPSTSTLKRFDAVQDPERAGGEGRWKVVRREGPRRVGVGQGAGEVPSPLKERRNKEGEGEDPERCLNAVRKLLQVYPLPRASEHVESLSTLLSGLLSTNASLEEESKRPLERPGNANIGAQNEFAIAAAKLEEELKNEQMEIFALEQLIEERRIKEARISKPTSTTATTTKGRTPLNPTSRGLTRPIAATSSSTLPSKSNPPPPITKTTPQKNKRDSNRLSRSSLPPLSPTSPTSPNSKTTNANSNSPVKTPRKSISNSSIGGVGGGSGGVPSYAAAQNRTPRHSMSFEQLVSASASGVASHETTPKKTLGTAGRKSIGAGVGSPTKTPGPTVGSGGKSGLKRKSMLPKGVTEDDLEIIASKIWNGIGDTLRPWARKWLISEGKDVPSPLAELDLAGTLSTLDTILSAPSTTKKDAVPNSPSISSTFNTLTSEQEDQLNEPLDLPNNIVIELELINLLLSTLRGLTPTLPTPSSTSWNLPPLEIIFRDSPLPSSLPSPTSTTSSPSTKNKKDPMVSMNLLKLYLGQFSKERGWGDDQGVGTTAIYGLVSKTVVRIDRRGMGKDGPVVGFK